jgi:hypothetical protein
LIDCIVQKEKKMAIDSVSGPGAGRVLRDYEDMAVELGGDVNAMVAVMVLQSGTDERHAADDAKALEENRLEAAAAEQVASFHEQADHLRAGATLDMLGAVVEGAVEIGSVFAGSKTKNILNGAGKVGKGVFTRLAGDQKADERDAAGEGSAAANRVQASERRLKDIQETRADARELINKALEFLGKAQQTDASTKLTVANAIRG